MPEELSRADPAVASPRPPVTRMDFPHHVSTYNRVLHLTKWFIAHLALLVISLYFFIIAVQGLLGALFLALAIGALIYGILSLPEGRTAAAAAAGLTDREPDERP